MTSKNIVVEDNAQGEEANLDRCYDQKEKVALAEIFDRYTTKFLDVARETLV